MKQRRAVFALGISIVVLACVLALVGRRLVGRRAPLVRPIPSASSASSASSAPSERKPPPALSASAPFPTSPRLPAPPYLDTTATTLAEHRAALFTNMRNQPELPAGAQAKIEAIFAA